MNRLVALAVVVLVGCTNSTTLWPECGDDAPCPDGYSCVGGAPDGPRCHAECPLAADNEARTEACRSLLGTDSAECTADGLCLIRCWTRDDCPSELTYCNAIPDVARGACF